jgi:hypothetical protein
MIASQKPHDASEQNHLKTATRGHTYLKILSSRQCAVYNV